MLPYQREGSKTVIEARIAPTIGVMASSAIRPKTATVIIILCMASITICRRSLVNPVGMAESTRQVTVSAC